MILSGVLRWLRRRDPGYQAIRRGLRLTLVGSLVFMGGRYGIGDVILAVFGLFSTLAAGFLARLPDEPRERVRMLLLALLPACLLTAIGTYLAFNTWVAAAGMLVVAFVVSFIGIGGPRVGGIAAGLQLFYILPCFPPYAPGDLPMRLAGVAAGIILLAVAELVLWPEPVPVPYLRRLGTAVEATASYLELIAETIAGRRGVGQELGERRMAAYEAAEWVRYVRLPPMQRPGSASARDWALRDATMTLRELLECCDRLPGLPGLPGIPGPSLPRVETVLGDTSEAAFPVSSGEAAPEEDRWPAELAGPEAMDTAALLRQSAAIIQASARTMYGVDPVVDLAELDSLTIVVEELRARPHPTKAEQHLTATVRLCVDAIAIQCAEHARTIATAARIATRLPVPLSEAQPRHHRQQFWYVRVPAPRLYWQRMRAHLTVRSVYLQGALRIALALGAARVIAGYLNLAHGFWVLLATLTLMRTSAADTRTTLRPAVQGTVLGAAAGALVLLLSHNPVIYQVTLPITMVLAFAVGPVLGLAWSQGMLTVLLMILFAQLGPADLQLVEARFVNVLLGAAIGILAGLLLWPRGSGGEVRRAMANYLESGAAAIQGTVRVLAGRDPVGGELGRAHEAMVLANASVLQYESERHGPPAGGIDWQMALLAGHQMVHGGEARLRSEPPPRLPSTDATAELEHFADQLVAAYVELARQLRDGRLTRKVPVPSPPKDFLDRVHTMRRAGETRPMALNLLDVEVWLVSLMTHLGQIQSPPTPSDEQRRSASESRH